MTTYSPSFLRPVVLRSRAYARRHLRRSFLLRLDSSWSGSLEAIALSFPFVKLGKMTYIRELLLPLESPNHLNWSREGRRLYLMRGPEPLGWLLKLHLLSPSRGLLRRLARILPPSGRRFNPLAQTPIPNLLVQPQTKRLTRKQA